MTRGSELLDLSGPLRTRGRVRQHLTASVVRELTPADLALLDAPRQSVPSPLKRLKDSHHRVARCFAAGMRQTQVCQQTGYSQSRLSILMADKSFQDLVEVYRKSAETEYLEYQDLATANMIKAERMVGDALENAEETPLTLGEVRPLLDIISDRADRFGYPKKTANLNLNVDFAGRLEKARQRSGLMLVESSPTPSPDKEPAAR